MTTVSIGIAGADDSDASAGELLRRADFAMYTAKDRGRARVETLRRRPARLTVSLRAVPFDQPAFVPPPYPHDRLGPIRATAAAAPGGILDASVGTPVDPMPAVVLDALAAGRAGRHRLPGHHRQPDVPRGCRRMGRASLRLLARPSTT